MSNEQIFRVTFSGVITDEFGLATTKKKFSKLFRLDPDQVDRFFTGEYFVLKDKSFEEVAMNFAIRIAESGCECYVETIPDDVETTTDKELDERRQGDRRVTLRRPSRPGTIGPDRRESVSRRNEDRPKPAEEQAATKPKKTAI